jgi:LysM repeat protein/prefoldin subunit 5
MANTPAFSQSMADFRQADEEITRDYLATQNLSSEDAHKVGVLEDAIEDAREEIEELENKAILGISIKDAYDSAKKLRDEAQSNLDALQAEYDAITAEIEKQQKTIDNYEACGNPNAADTAIYRDALKQKADLEKKYEPYNSWFGDKSLKIAQNKLDDKQAVFNNMSTEWNSIQSQITQLENDIKVCENEITSIKGLDQDQYGLTPEDYARYEAMNEWGQAQMAAANLDNSEEEANNPSVIAVENNETENVTPPTPIHEQYVNDQGTPVSDTPAPIHEQYVNDQGTPVSDTPTPIHEQNVNEQGTPTTSTTPATTPTNETPAPVDNSQPATGETYQVVSGDSLSAIAAQKLGDGSRWPELVELNKDKYPGIEKNPDLILVGWVLTLPSTEEEPEQQAQNNEQLQREEDGPAVNTTEEPEQQVQNNEQLQREEDGPAVNTTEEPEQQVQNNEQLQREENGPNVVINQDTGYAEIVENDDLPEMGSNGVPQYINEQRYNSGGTHSSGSYDESSSNHGGGGGSF